jgi:hypothetical protein
MKTDIKNHLKIFPNVNLTSAFYKIELSIINQSNISEKVKGHGKITTLVKKILTSNFHADLSVESWN